jgi:hypothetical protein
MRQSLAGFGVPVVTDQAVVEENLSNFTEQLATERDATKRARLLNLLIDEMNELGFGREQLDIANAQIASGRRLIARQRGLIAHLAQHGRDTQLASSILASLMHSQTLFEAFRRQILDMIDRRVL